MSKNSRFSRVSRSWFDFQIFRINLVKNQKPPLPPPHTHTLWRSWGGGGGGGGAQNFGSATNHECSKNLVKVQNTEKGKRQEKRRTKKTKENKGLNSRVLLFFEIFQAGRKKFCWNSFTSFRPLRHLLNRAAKNLGCMLIFFQEVSLYPLLKNCRRICLHEGGSWCLGRSSGARTQKNMTNLCFSSSFSSFFFFFFFFFKTHAPIFNDTLGVTLTIGTSAARTPNQLTHSCLT